MSSLKSLAARGLQAMDFPPTMKPRKDGRYHSISPKQRQKRVIRIIIGIATATAIYTCLLYSGKTASNDVKHYYLAGYYDSWGAATVHTTTSPSRTEDEKCADERAKTIEDAFQKLIAVVPDEADARDLLRPIEGSGTERLRDLGIRTRVYKRLLDAWEELHLISIENSLYIRDDVMQHLWSRGTKVSKLSPSGFAELVRSYESYRSLILNLGSLLFPWTAPHFPDHMTLHTQISHGGRGIVTTAGNDQALYLLTTITMMRKLGCKLPIEIMYLGIDDLDQNHRDSFERISGVVLRDIRQMVNDQGWEIKGWAGKPFAILLSSFKEVIFVDADALFFEDPAVLFEDPAYIETGALFFHDRLMMPGNKRSWLKEILPEPITKSVQRSRLWTGQSVHMQESGVVLIDKWRHFVPMLLVSRMNGPDRDGNKEKGITGVYDMLYGM
jgi:alpha 1,3-mannosyltransferase